MYGKSFWIGMFYGTNENTCLKFEEEIHTSVTDKRATYTSLLIPKTSCVIYSLKNQNWNIYILNFDAIIVFSKSFIRTQ